MRQPKMVWCVAGRDGVRGLSCGFASDGDAFAIGLGVEESGIDGANANTCNLVCQYQLNGW